MAGKNALKSVKLPSLKLGQALFTVVSIDIRLLLRHRINLYPLNRAIGSPNVYPLDSDLSGG